MRAFGASDYDEILAALLEEVPAGLLDDVVVRAQMRPSRGETRPSPEGATIVLYREPALLEARSREDLCELVRRALSSALLERERAHA